MLSMACALPEQSVTCSGPIVSPSLQCRSAIQARSGS